MKMQFKKIITHALNLMDYTSKQHKVFKTKHTKITLKSY